MRLRTIAAALVVAAPFLVLESPSAAACWEGRGYGYAAAGYAAPRYGYMQAYDDQLSKRCQFALYRVSRNLESVVNRVGRIADACWNDIQEKCGDADKMGQCVMEKRASHSQPCQTVINDLQQAYQGLAALRGQTVQSSDGKELGQVVEVKKDPDGQNSVHPA